MRVTKGLVFVLTVTACLYLSASAMAAVTGAQFVPLGSQLIPSDAVGPAGFGAAVALSGDGDTLLVGGPNDNGGDGAAWVYQRSGSAWRETAKLTDPVQSSDGQPQRFGQAVALSDDGNTALVSGVDQDSFGSVAVFVRAASGSWILEATLNPQGLATFTSEGKPIGTGFGDSVALSGDGDTALVGAGTDTCYGCGAAVAFTRIGTTWSQQGAPIRPDDETQPLALDEVTGESGFGSSVVLDATGDTAVIGDGSDSESCGVACLSPGAVWRFVRQSGVWSQDGSKLTDLSHRSFNWGDAEALSASGAVALVASGTPTELSFAPATSETTTSALSRFPAGSVALSGDATTALEGAGTYVSDGDAAESFVLTRAGWAAEPGLPEAGASESDAGVALSANGETAVVTDEPADLSLLYQSPSIGGLWTYTREPASFVVPSVQQVNTDSSGGYIVTGRGFNGVTSVTVAGQPATNWLVISPSQIDVQVENTVQATPTNVVVSTPAGNSLQRLIPGAVRDLRAHVHGTTATISFRPVARTGYPITYSVRALPTKRTIRTTHRTVVFHALAHGRTYRFVVTASDQFGTGPASRTSKRVVGR